MKKEALARRQPSERRALGARGDGVDECVRLAVALDGCVAFNPKRWRQVLDKSSTVLHRRKSDAPGNLNREDRKRTPLSREEDARTPVESSRALPTLSVSQYLNQPEMVRDLLKEAEGAYDQEEEDLVMDPELQIGDQENEDDTGEGVDENDEVVTDREAKEAALVVLPLLRTVSPRTRRGLAHLPPPSEAEMRGIDSFERSVDHPEFFEDFYRELKRKRMHQARRQSILPGKSMTLPRSIALRKTKRPCGTIKPLRKRKEIVARAATLAVTSADEKERAREVNEQKSMEKEDTRESCLTNILKVKVSNQLHAPSRTLKPKRSHSYSRLIQEQHHAELQHGAAEFLVKETIDEIKQWIPLDVIYALGFGKFSSPAQQRATEVLFRVGVRLQNQLLFLGMRHWKGFVLSMQEQEWEYPSIRLQCWWRQICAKREVSTRRRIRNELQRRQEAFLALLASKEQQAACRITRCVRNYVFQHSRERAATREKAAVCIQSFWRKLCTQWAALRRELHRQRQTNAAVVIQKYVRRILAQRRRVLLSKIDCIEKRRRQKAVTVAGWAKNTKMVGAAIFIQRAFRNWQQKKVLILRRRRAAFERDKKKILTVQAHYRGQQGRRWVTKHKRDISKAIATLQCSWRCFLARCELWRRKKQALAQRNHLLNEIEEDRRNRKSNALVPIHLQKKWNQFSLLKAATMLQPGDPSNSREVQAARKLQARWRGKQIRKRLRYEKAKEIERSRRQVNRKRRLAAVCIQKRVRGIRGRAYAWELIEERSAERIQRVWRGYKTRIQLLKMRYALKMINRIQARWKARRNLENQRFRALNAAILQRAARKFIGRRMLSTVVRRRQFLAEEGAVGKVLEEKTRSRVKDELLLQSFCFKALKVADEKERDALEEIRVDRSLYVVNFAKREWKRKGYDGIWQEIFRNASGNSSEMDNSHFARFLKSLPHAFIHRTQFPMQNADVIFAKMKEPKAKTISFQRFNQAILMLLKERFVDTNHKEAKKGSEPVDTGSELERFLRFMNRFVLPSTIQNGKYRKMLEAHCTKRLLWSVSVLRRFAVRIATKNRHDKFVILFREEQMHKHRSKCASTIQLAYRCYKFCLQLKEMLASMFIEFVDHTGRTVRFQHIGSEKILTKRPLFLKGVKCGKIVPLPFPGEEFHAFCERHEDSTNPSASNVPAEVYCVECEDAMCQVCFDRDHTARQAFQRHQRRQIQKCSYCRLETATRECLQCGNGKAPFCDSCFPHVHKQSSKQPKREVQGSLTKEEVKSLTDQPVESQHKFQTLVVMCAECSDRVAQWACETCLDVFCKRCMSSYHAKGQRQYHHCRRLNYFSILRQKAELKRDVDAEKERERRKKEREKERRQQEAELQRQHLAATTMQALIRSFVARQSGKAYMKLVRQTQAARAQRKKDDRVRASIVYKAKAAFGVSPALKSDTKREMAARQERIDDIKRTLFFQRRPTDKANQKKRWSKRQKARVLESVRTWCDYDAQVKILKGEWKNCVGSIVSTQNLMLTGSVLVFVPLANRSAVVRWEDIEPYDEALRQPYEPPGRVALNITQDLQVKLRQILQNAVRKARLLYLQTIEFNRITQYAWVIDYDKREQKVEYWNVVLNRRVATPPKVMQLIERMEPEDREKLEKRVELARSKLVALLNPFQPRDKPKLALRRNGIVFVPNGAIADDSSSALASLKHEMEAIDGARFWHDKVVPNRQFGGKKARDFLAASPSNACWLLVKLFNWMDLHEDGGFEPHAKKLLNLSEELQRYVVREVSDRFESSGDVKLARDKLLRLMDLKDATLQLLMTKDQRDVEEVEARQAP